MNATETRLRESASRENKATNADYDPLECLSAEVERFKATNQFTPMLVTGFYLQAACVITELRAARKLIKKQREALEFYGPQGDFDLGDYELKCAEDAGQIARDALNFSPENL